jgi:lipoate-protein ligase A
MSESSQAVCRVLPLSGADGFTLMAANEVLLHSAADRAIPSLHFYTWSEATLSLGYFQSNALRSASTLSALPFVRRSTGGGAIVHHHEVTYALALPAGKPWISNEPWTCRMHRLIATALDPLGVTLRTVVCGEEKKLDDLLCFHHYTPGDLAIGPRKVVGSAQRKLRGAILQHGSILLRQSPHTPSLPGIRELSGIDLSAKAVADLVLKQLELQTEWKMEEGKWSNAEQEQIQQIREEKYAANEWNCKR